MTRIEPEPGRPRGFLTARWADLAMLSYEADAAFLAPLLPARTRLDLFEGRILVSLVGLRFLDARLLGLPVPFHRDFEQVNLRFYVRRDTEQGERRGVAFIKQIVPRAAVAWLARLAYHESFLVLPMSHEESPSGGAVRGIVYRWRHAGRWQRLGVRASGEPLLPAPESEEAFVMERCWGYARRRDGATLEYGVEHPRWRIRRAFETDLDCDVAALYGPEVARFLAGRPSSAFLAEGSAVALARGRRLP